MRQLDLISYSRADKKKPLRLRGFAWSAILHALLGTAVLALSFLCHAQFALVHPGPVDGAPVVSLETIEIIADPAPPAPPSPTVNGLPAIADIPLLTTPAMSPRAALSPVPPELALAVHPVVGIPILPGQTTPPELAISIKTGTPFHAETITPSSGGGIMHLRPATDKFVYSYDYGLSVLPHPPYPAEARDLEQTGVVRMLVEFDKAGNVARTEIAKSSGVPVLDSETSRFIRNNWHSITYAGRSISIPVEYTLTSL